MIIFGSFGILLSYLLCFVGPAPILIVVCSFIVQGTIQIWGHHQWIDFVHDLHKILYRSPFIADLEHVGTNLAFIINIRVIYFGNESHNWRFEGKVVKFEANAELATCKGWLFRTQNIDVPDSVALGLNNIIPE